MWYPVLFASFREIVSPSNQTSMSDTLRLRDRTSSQTLRRRNKPWHEEVITTTRRLLISFIHSRCIRVALRASRLPFHLDVESSRILAYCELRGNYTTVSGLRGRIACVKNNGGWVSGVLHPLCVKYWRQQPGGEGENLVTTDGPKSWRLKGVKYILPSRWSCSHPQ